MKLLTFIKHTLFLVIALVIQQSYSQKFEKKIDSIITTVFKDKNGPGGVFLVAKEGKPIYRKAFGKSNIELDVNMEPKNVFQIGSMTKQFTAVAILILAEQGKINVNHFISRYITDYPNGNQITIHHLLTHTSGIKDFTKMKSIMGVARKDLSPKELVNFFKDEPVDFLPGKKFDYNNSGYVVLGYIIELVSGLTYEEFIKKYIFERLEMNNSYYASNRDIIQNRAYGYHNRDKLTNKMYISLSIPYSSGSLMSNVDDLLKWQEALKNNILLSPRATSQLFTNYTLTDESQINYGYGWHLKDINALSTIEHGGSIFGFKSMAVYVPSYDVYVVGLSNCDCNSPTKVTRDIVITIIDEFRK